MTLPGTCAYGLRSPAAGRSTGGGRWLRVSFIGTDRRHPRLFSGPMAEPRNAAAMEHNPDLDTLAVLHCAQADLREQIRLSQETVERSQELLRRIDDLLAESPLKP